MQYNYFTILIPTRERADTLRFTIAACLNQTYEHFQIIVSDNYSQDNTAEVVKSMHHAKLTYVNTGKRVSMSENFDFALAQVKSGYVMFIGDDDGILPNCLEYVNRIIEATQVEAVVSHNALYTWPGTPKPNELFWSPENGYQIRNAQDWIRKYLTFNMQYTFDLPGAYCGFVKREVFDRAMVGGSFFRSSTPDAYSAFAVAFNVSSYVYSNTAFAVHGASARSNGAAYLSNKKNEEGVESKLFFKENSIPFHKDIVMTKAFRVSSMEAFLQFSNAFPAVVKGFEVDWKRFLTYVMTERTEVKKDEIEEAVQKMCLMHGIDYRDVLKNVPKGVNSISLTNIVERGFRKIGNTVRKKRPTHIKDTTIYGVQTIYDACLLLKFFLNKIK